jgi:chromosome partitioning protein
MVKQTQLNQTLDIVGVLCAFSERTNVSNDVETQLRRYFGTLVFDTVILKNISLEEAHSNHTHVFEYAPSSAGARAYKALVKEVLARCNEEFVDYFLVVCQPDLDYDWI